jgi:hypothetical protein
MVQKLPYKTFITACLTDGKKNYDIDIVDLIHRWRIEDNCFLLKDMSSMLNKEMYLFYPFDVSICDFKSESC